MPSLKNLSFSSRVGNAACPITQDAEGIRSLLDSEAGFVVIKTTTLESRIGNPLPYTFSAKNYTINNIGLSNHGVDYYISALKDIPCINKPIIASVATFSTEETLEIIRLYEVSKVVDALEINISCPNVNQKSVLGYNPNELDTFLQEVFQQEWNIPIGLKLPPYLNQELLVQICQVINHYDIAFVTSINTLGNALILSNGRSVLKGNQGLGGLSGQAVKPIGLGNVKNLRSYLRADIQIYGVGGVNKPVDAEEYISVGADFVQIGTHAWLHGLGIFSKCKNIKKS